MCISLQNAHKEFGILRQCVMNSKTHRAHFLQPIPKKQIVQVPSLMRPVVLWLEPEAAMVAAFCLLEFK
jgi:hypothetical protein